MTLRQLTYLIALAETRHFGQAAARCHVSQPALSVQIREMEDRLGVRLVDRDGRRIRFTPAGQEVLSSARRIAAEMERLHDAVRWKDGLSGKLKLGVIPTVAPYLLPVALPLLRARDVTLDLRVREAQTDRLIADLRDGRLDAAVMALPSAADFAELPLFEDRFLLAGSQAQIAALADRDALRPRALDPDRLLLLDEGHCLADQALEVCGMRRSATRVDLGASSLGTLGGLVAAGFGMTFLPELALETERAAAPGMAVVRFATPEPSRMIGLVRRAGEAGNDGWFRELAGLLIEAALPVLDRVRAAVT